MSDKKIKFRGAIGGYNKEDVNGYIESLNSKYYEAELEYKNKIAELEKSLKAVRTKSEESERIVLELQEKVAGLEEKNLDLTKAKGELEAQLEKGVRSAEEYNELNDRLAAMDKENGELKAKFAQQENQGKSVAEAYEKSSRYDKISEQIGSMIVNANVRAEGIVSTAKQKARAISNGMIDTTREKLLEMGNRYTNAVISDSEELSDMLRAMAECVEGFRSELTANVGIECDKLKEELEIIRKTEVITEENNG